MSFDKDKIIIDYEEGSSFYKIRYKEGARNSKIMFQLDHAKIPFGLDVEYEQYYITIEVREKDYIEYIKSIESGLSEKLCDKLFEDGIIFDDVEFKTQIRKFKGGYYIKTKIPQFKDKFNVTCIDQNGYHKSILDIDKGIWGTFILYIDYAWLRDNSIHYKWKIHRLEIE